jgi:DNA polymerase-1
MFDNQQMDFVRQALFNMGIITTGSTIDKSYLNDYYSYGEVIIYTVNISGVMYKKFLDEIGTIDIYEELDSYNDIDYVYDSKYFYTVITNIEQSRNTVYDLCIPNSHSFIANGIINHNTGRVSSDSPNLQNIPSRPFKLSDGTEIDSGHDVRQLFTATPGYILLSCDYSGQEVRVAAHVSNDKKMIQAYRDNKDVYSEIAAVAFNKEYEECCEKRPDGTDNPEGKARRGEAKKIVLGILYGRGIPSIAEQLGKTIQEAQNIYDKVLNKFDGLSKFIESAEDVARELGYTETVWGRRRQLPDIQLPYYEFKYKNGMSPNIDPLDLDISDDDIAKLTNEVPDDIIVDLTKKLLKCRGYKQREQLKEQIRANGFTIKDNTSNIAQAQRQIINGIVQGSSADLTKLAQIELYNNQELKELGFRMLIPVHDEIIAECPIENVKRCAELMSYCMVHAGSDLCVPLKCDVALFKSWYGKEIDINSL